MEARRRGSRPGIVLIIVGASLFVLGWLGGLVSFFIPISGDDRLVGAITFLLPALVGIGGFVVALVGVVLVVVAAATRPNA